MYRAFAVSEGGHPIVEDFESNVEYLVGDELPLDSARWRVEAIGRELTITYSPATPRRCASSTASSSPRR